MAGGQHPHLSLADSAVALRSNRDTIELEDFLDIDLDSTKTLSNKDALLSLFI